MVNRRLAALTAGVALLIVADRLLLETLAEPHPAARRLLLPVLIYSLFVGAKVRDGWLFATLAVAAYVTAESGARLLAEGREPDWTYATMIPWAALVGWSGRAAGRSRRLRHAQRALALVLFHPGAEAADGELERIMKGRPEALVDPRSLHEGGLLALAEREDREAAAHGRLWGYAIAGCGIAAFLVTDRTWILGIAGGVFFMTFTSWLLSFVGSAGISFDAIRTGYFELASGIFARRLQSRPLDALAHLGLGLARLHAGDVEDAQRQFALAKQLGLTRFSTGVWVGLERATAMALYQHGAFDRALDGFLLVLRVFTDHAPTLYYVARCHADAGRDRMADRWLRRAADAGHAPALRWLADRESEATPTEPVTDQR